MTIHNALGSGFQEVVCQRALQIEMDDQGLFFAREFEMPIHYKKVRMRTRRVNFWVQDNISVELKAVKRIEDVHLEE
jgi:GxxExxY protein